jgi:hypothetical protein
MANGHFGFAGAFVEDPGAYNQRQHRARQAREEFDARVYRFLGIELYGKSFRSLEALTDAACAAAVTHQGRALSDEQHAALDRCCRALWGGVALRQELEQPYSRWNGCLTIGEPKAGAA